MKKKELESIVIDTMTKFPITRTDDYYLIYAVFKNMNSKVKDMGFSEVMKNHTELGLPSFESVTRCRRKVQETHQDLINWKTAVKRAEEKEIILEYVRN